MGLPDRYSFFSPLSFFLFNFTYEGNPESLNTGGASYSVSFEISIYWGKPKFVPGSYQWASRLKLLQAPRRFDGFRSNKQKLHSPCPDPRKHNSCHAVFCGRRGALHYCIASSPRRTSGQRNTITSLCLSTDKPFHPLVMSQVTNVDPVIIA